MVWRVADASAYLVITGGGIPDIKIVKKAWVYPWQKCKVEYISPFDFEITLQAMTIEKLQFSLPAVFTIGPEDTNEKLKMYFKLLTGPSGGQESRRQAATGRSHVQDIVKGIIEGETRVIVSSMTMEEIFKERQIFKNKVIEQVQAELDQFGLKIYNANVKELQDTPGSEYFKFLSRKAHEGASNQAKVDVANACMIGEIGEAEKRGKTKQEISKIDAETAVLETKRKSEKAKADAELTTTQTKLNTGINLVNITATRQAEIKDAELQRDVQLKRAEMASSFSELERMRATDLVQATIKKESAQQAAEAKLYSETKDADGLRYKQKQDAEAQLYSETKHAEGTLIKERQDAEAHYYRIAKDAEASLYAEKKSAEAVTARAEATFFAKKKEAEAMTEMAKAYGHMSDVMGGPQGLLQYMMLQDGTYEKLARANAEAIKGLEPKITVWNTGEGSSGSNDGTGAIRNIMQALPPLLSTINDQTGISPPAWLAQMGQVMSKGKQVNGTHVNGQANGH